MACGSCPFFSCWPTMRYETSLLSWWHFLSFLCYPTRNTASYNRIPVPCIVLPTCLRPACPRSLCLSLLTPAGSATVGLQWLIAGRTVCQWEQYCMRDSKIRKPNHNSKWRQDESTMASRFAIPLFVLGCVFSPPRGSYRRRTNTISSVIAIVTAQSLAALCMPLQVSCIRNERKGRCISLSCTLGFSSCLGHMLPFFARIILATAGTSRRSAVCEYCSCRPSSPYLFLTSACLRVQSNDQNKATTATYLTSGISPNAPQDAKHPTSVTNQGRVCLECDRAAASV